MSVFSKTYDIERFWCPVDGVIGSDQWGFLQDPRTHTVWMGRSDSVPFECIEDIPVLALLGEPGTGKSQWFRNSQNNMLDTIHRRGHQALWIDLGLYDTASDVVNAVFRHTEFVQWAQGEGRLQLFLDSFDECHFRVEVLPKRFLSELREQPIERLCLRILCRTSEWPQSLESGLKNLWDDGLGRGLAGAQGEATNSVSAPDPLDQFVQVFEMTPFRRGDFNQIVSGEGLEPGSFLKEIHARRLVPFAFRPQTLFLLVKTYKETGRFPANQVELYREGCLELCREPQDRTDTRCAGDFQSDELFAAATRLAALTVFCNRHAIAPPDIPLGDVKDGELSSQEICDGVERVNGREVLVRNNIVRETLNTGLFSGRPGGRMGWAHQTYAEFLAAEYLCRNEVPSGQIMTLIQHPQWSERKIPPQLSETAAWLSLMKRNLLDMIMGTDPEILLLKRQHADLGLEQDEQNERLVGSLLKLLDEGRILDLRISRMLRLDGLQHPNIEEQLAPYIVDRLKSFVVRRVALRIAGENEAHNLQNAICSVALDPRDDYVVRKSAVHALLRIASEDCRFGLKPLALGRSGNDPDDELKGCALKLLWPEFLTGEELFDNLTIPKNPNLLFGSYGTFLEERLVDSMEVCHLPAALRWVQRQPRDQRRPYSFNKLIDHIMGFAYEHLAYPVVVEHFAKAAFHRLQSYEPIMPYAANRRDQSILFDDDLRRRRLVQKMLRVASGSAESPRMAAHFLADILCQRDTSWLVDLFQREPERKTKDILALLISWFFRPADKAAFEIIYRLSMVDTTLAIAMRSRLGPIDLESEEADMMRRSFTMNQEQGVSDDLQQRQRPCPQNVIRSYLAEIEQGNTLRFASLSWQMVNSESDSWSSDITKLSSWADCDRETRKRIVNAAINYIRECDPLASEWVGTNKILWSARAGYVALVLMLRVVPNSLSILPSATWVKWMPAIVVCSSGSEDTEWEMLMTAAYSSAPDQTISYVNSQIDYENEKNKTVYIMGQLDRFWDARLTKASLNKLNDTNLKFASIDAILTAIAKRDPKAAINFAESKLEVPLPARGRERTMALVAAKALMLYVPVDGWPIVWQAIASARLFGRRLLSGMADEAYWGLESFFEQLTEDSLVSLYIWMSREFPIPEDEKSVRVSRGPSVHDIQERILKELEDRGTMGSVAALQHLCRKLPEEADRLRWVLEAAKQHTLASTWMPWRPEDVLGVVQDHQKRLVQTGDQLLEVIIESMSRFQDSLHGELPAVEDLWDRQHEQSQGKKKISWRPVDEPVFSNRIARHLRDDLIGKGIVIGREVQIRPGQKTDIHVDAVAQETSPYRFGLVKAIIEVKGCWNDGLETDMEGQLLSRYMAENDCGHGLYMIGWFYCDSWDKRDYRCIKPRKEIADMPIEQAVDRFAVQAADLSAKSGKVIRSFVLDARR